MTRDLVSERERERGPLTRNPSSETALQRGEASAICSSQAQGSELDFIIQKAAVNLTKNAFWSGREALPQGHNVGRWRYGRRKKPGRWCTLEVQLRWRWRDLLRRSGLGSQKEMFRCVGGLAGTGTGTVSQPGRGLEA